ncbi:MAG: ribonuclease PH [Methylacidiphilales bacterium]|nr:ribonuclease PH [Candidatus Methylacidiphilales bacterium]MDW8349338.1 ribonuclease PH [Verrucomicrobiae bacterium]
MSTQAPLAPSPISGPFCRKNGRSADAFRVLQCRTGIIRAAAGSVLISYGDTEVICAVTYENQVPRWMKEQGLKGGWLTAEYSMLPYSTATRKPRDITKGKLDGRSVEIQRLIGRALRACLDLENMEPITLTVDCDVLNADGGTRTAAITGGAIALSLAIDKLIHDKILSTSPLRALVAAVSVGVVHGQILLDLDYIEDSQASVDMNVVMDSHHQLIEVQASGEESTFSEAQFHTMLELAKKGIRSLTQWQSEILAQSKIKI